MRIAAALVLSLMATSALAFEIPLEKVERTAIYSLPDPGDEVIFQGYERGDGIRFEPQKLEDVRDVEGYHDRFRQPVRPGYGQPTCIVLSSVEEEECGL